MFCSRHILFFFLLVWNITVTVSWAMRKLHENSWSVSMACYSLQLSLGRRSLLTTLQHPRNSTTEVVRAPWVSWQVTGCLWVLPRTQGPVSCTTDPSVDSSLVVCSCERSSPIPTLVTVPHCVLRFFRAMPHKSARLPSPRWERLPACPHADPWFQVVTHRDWKVTQGQEHPSSIFLST